MMLAYFCYIPKILKIRDLFNKAYYVPNNRFTKKVIPTTCKATQNFVIYILCIGDIYY